MQSNLALIEAAKCGDLQAAEEALQAGADVNAVIDDWTALCWAAQEGHIDIVELLLDAGANVNFSDHGGISPLKQAVSWSHIIVAERLILRGAEVNHRDVTEGGTTMLHTAAAYGLLECIHLLLLYGADPKARCAQGQTPYDLAIECGETEAATLLDAVN